MPGEVASFDVLGVRVHALTPELAIEQVRDMVAGRDPGYLVFCTVSSVLSARDEPLEATAIARARLVTPDGMPLVWLGRRAGVGDVQRVYGPDFMIDLMSDTGGEFRHYFYGGGPGVAEDMAARLKERFPDLVVAGAHAPPLGLDPLADDRQEIDRLNDAGADIVWVGLGHPKQDIWMHAQRERVEAPVLAGVGAAFDFHSGRKKEAPQWMKRSGTQWLHRLASEPGRLWKRYLLGNSRFVWLLARERLFGPRT